jgi:hypothetical protein
MSQCVVALWYAYARCEPQSCVPFITGHAIQFLWMDPRFALSIAHLSHYLALFIATIPNKSNSTAHT